MARPIFIVDVEATCWEDRGHYTVDQTEIIEIGYLPELGPDNVSAYRIKARLVGEAGGGGGGGADQTPRLGLRGVARLFGREVSLGYYLFRRPVALVWQYLGWLW